VAYDLPSLGIPLAAATTFANDPDGNLWIGFYTGGVARVQGGKFTFFTETDGVPKGFIRHLFFDSRKRLWIATGQNGVARVDDPSATPLEFIPYTVKEGLSSNQVTTVTEDRFGRIYFGTRRGIDRLEPESSRIKHFTTADGLADNFVNTSLADADGVLWFGTLHGLSRLVPEPDTPQSVPAVFISGLRIDGIKQAISGFGQTEVSLADLAPDQNQLEMDFFSISNRAGDYLRYQYKFDGDADWSAPSVQRTVTLASLPAASYRFYVRAVNSDNLPSAVPAVISFRILPPIWQRWWFIALGLLAVGGAILSIYSYRIMNLRRVNAALSEAKLAEERLRKYREERLADLERVRSRIATDLHDDIGASLTQIAILSEVARQKNRATDDKGNSEQLSAIYGLSNELVSTMSDIVWAINPHKDKLHDLTLRMRRFASDVLSAQNIDLEFEAPEDLDNFPLDSNLRREVFLIFKESVNNIVKHADATAVEIDLKIDRNNLFLSVKDNGKGFRLQAAQETPMASLFANYKGGNGLASLKRRATEMGGEFAIASEIGKGTTLNLRLPVTIQSGGDAATRAD
jgi:signal transduction histidine kinase